jgi:hypothetical protein
MKVLLLTIFFCVTLGNAAAQAAPAGNAPAVSRHTRSKKSSSGVLRTECVEAAGLCVNVPATWQRLGNIFDDLGFVVVEPRPRVESAEWPQITVAAIDVSSKKANGVTPSLDSLIEMAVTPDGSYAVSETQRRTRLLLNGANAEILRVKLHDDASGQDALKDAIEEVALIEGDDGIFYSLALRCSPQDLARLDPVFLKVANSWRLKPPAAPPEPQSEPAQDPDKK